MTVHHGGKVGKADKTLGAKYFSTSAQKDSAPENTHSYPRPNRYRSLHSHCGSESVRHWKSACCILLAVFQVSGNSA